MAEGAVSQAIVYDFQYKSEKFAAHLKALYEEMNRIAGGAEKVGKTIRSVANDKSGLHRIKTDAEYAEKVLRGVGTSASDSGKSVRQLTKEMATLREAAARIDLNRLNDPTSAAAAKTLRDRVAMMQKLVDHTRTQAAEATRANQASREALRIAERHNDQLMSMMRRAAAVAASYLSIQQGAKAVKVGADFNMMIEQNQMAFQVMLKSQTMASTLIQDLRNIQTQTGIGIREGAESAKQLLAYGFQYDGMIKNMTMLKTVAGAVNAPLQDIVYVYGTLRSQGRAYTRDIMQFAMRGIPIYEALAQTMGVSTSEIKRLTEEGAVGFTEVEKAMQFMTSPSGPFGGMLEARMGTLTGKVDLLGKQFESTMGAIMEASTPAITAIVEELTVFLQKLDVKSFGASLRVLFKEIANGLPALVSGVAAFFKTVTDGMSAMTKMANILMPVISTLAQVLGMVAPVLLPALAGGLLTGGVGKMATGIGGALSLAAFRSSGMAMTDVDRSAALAAGASGGVKGAFDNVKYLMGTLMNSPFFKATLWGVGIAGLAGVVAVISNEVKKVQDAQITAGFTQGSSAAGRAAATQALLDQSGLGRMYAADRGLGTSAAQFAVNMIGVQDVQNMAKNASVPLALLAEELLKLGRISQSTYESLTLNHGIVERGSQAGGRSMPAWQGIYDVLGLSPTQLADLQNQERAASKSFGVGANAYTDYGRGDLRGKMALQNLPQQGAIAQAGILAGAGLPKETVDALLIPALESQAEYVLSLIKNVAAFSQATGESENSLLKTFGDQYQVIQDQLTARGKIAQLDLWTVKELEAQLTETRLDDIQLEHDKRVQSYADQVKAKTMLQSEADRAIVLSQQMADQEAYQYKMSLLIAEDAERTAREESFKQLRLDNEKRIADEKDALRQAQIQAANPFAGFGQKFGEDYQAAQGGLFMGAGQMMGFAGDWGAYAMRAAGQGDLGGVAQGAGGMLGSLGSAALQGAGGLAMGAGSMGLSFLMEAFTKLSGVMKIFQAPLETAAKVLGPFSEAITYVIEPLQQALIPVLNLLKPVLAVFAAIIQVAVASLMSFKPVLDILTTVLTFLADYVLIPVINFFILLRNALSSFVTFITFGVVDMGQQAFAKTTTELQAMADAAEAATKAFEANKDVLEDSMSYLENQIKDKIDSMISSAQDLYEVGAISAEEYQRQVDVINSQYSSVVDKALPYQISAAKSLDDLVKLYKQAAAVSNILSSDASDTKKQEALASWLSSVTSMAVGTGNLPQDMLINAHQGEGIVPADFMDSIRSGDLVLSGSRGSTGGGDTTIVYMTVEGTVTTVDDLAVDMMARIPALRRSGRVVTQ